MSRFLYPIRLWQKAALLFLVVAVLLIVEVATAFWFKESLTKEFDQISRFGMAERNLQFGLMISADLVYDLSSQRDELTKSQADKILRNLYQIVELKKRGAGLVSDEKSAIAIRNSITELNSFKEWPVGKSHLKAFNHDLVKAVNSFSKKIHVDIFRLNNKRSIMVNNYKEKGDIYAFILIGIGLLGFIIICTTSVIFISHLVRSLEKLEKRAKDITEGNYGAPLETDRGDEIGRVIGSVNAMAKSLEHWEGEVAEWRRRLLQQEKMFTIGTFAAGIVHEVGNPIQAIAALSSQVVESLGSDASKQNVEKNIERIAIIVEQTDRLEKVVREVREVTYTGNPEKVKSDVNGVIHNTMRLMRYDHRFRKIKVSTDLEDDLPDTFWVPDHFTQLLMNLLINAADAIDDGNGHIIVSSSLANNKIRLSVSDNGCGMSGQDLARASEPFYTTKMHGKGTGLGLAVCKQIVEEHGGELEIISSLGSGATITASIPVVSELNVSGH